MPEPLIPPLMHCRECYVLIPIACNFCPYCGHFTQAYCTRQRKKDEKANNPDTSPAADPAQSV